MRNDDTRSLRGETTRWPTPGRGTAGIGALAAVALAVASLAGGGAPVSPARAQGAAPADPAAIVAERQAGLKRMGQNMEAIKAVVDGRGDARTVTARAEDIRAWFATFPARFPAGTDTANNTKARPEVWSNRAGFERHAANATTAADVLVRATATGDAAATGTALGNMAAACTACHRENRAR